MFSLLVSDRRLITALLLDTLKLDEEPQIKVRRMMDKRKKMTETEFLESLKELGLSEEQAQKVELFMTSSFEDLDRVIDESILVNNKGYWALKEVFELCKTAGIDKYIKFDPSIIRGFDYSDGLVYEVFDKNPANARSIFGGERFDRLIEIFGQAELPATGFAMGDYTLLEFLKNWKLLPELKSNIDYFITVWPSSDKKEQNGFFKKSQEIGQIIRSKGKNCLLWLELGEKLEKQLKYADKKNARYVIICGEEELKQGIVTVKDMQSMEQKMMKISEL